MVSCRCYPLFVGKVDTAVAVAEEGHPIDHVLEVDLIGTGECNRRRVRRVGSCRRGVGKCGNIVMGDSSQLVVVVDAGVLEGLDDDVAASIGRLDDVVEDVVEDFSGAVSGHRSRHGGKCDDGKC